jgi:arabinosyltransferase C
MSAPAATTDSPSPSPAGTGAVAVGGRDRRRLLAWVLAGVTLLLAVTLPLAPVRVDTPEVQWPLDTSDPQSTVALFMPYRPIDLQAEIPCAAVAALADRQEPGTAPGVLLATARPDSAQGSARGLRATVTQDDMRIVSSGEELYSGDVPESSDCTITITADQSGTTAVLEEPGSGSEVLGEVPGLLVPEVTAFTTDLTSADGTSPTVTAHPDARFQTEPTALKTTLVVAHVAALLGCLLLLWRAGPASHRRRREPLPALAEPPTGRGGRAWAVLADVGVVVTLVVWTLIGFMNTDDYYYSVEARTLDSAGFVGNQFRFFNVPEIPFVLHQTLLAPLTELSTQPLVIRLPSLVAGLAVWWLLTRQLVPLLVDRPHPALRIVAGLALLAWWLPWNIGARPEFLITLAWAATLTLALQAIRRQRVWMLGAAALVAGTAVTITASGLSCAATLIVLLPRLWPLLRRSALGLWATLALAAASASVAITIVFYDATLATALTALRVHREVGPVEPWYQEVLRYWYLTLGPDPAQRTFARQLAVLVTLAVLVGVSVVLIRVTLPAAQRTTWAVPALAYLAANLAFLVSPTKWTHHFGALAAPGALVLTVGVAVLVRRRPDRWASGALAVGLGITAAIVYHAGNHQVEYSSFGVVKELPGLLGNPVAWLLVALGSCAVVWWAWRRSDRPRPAIQRPWPEAVIGTMVAALLASVLVQTGSAAAATYRLRDSWSMAKDTTSVLTGNPTCGFADRSVALTEPAPLPVAEEQNEGDDAASPPSEDVPVLEPADPGEGNEGFPEDAQDYEDLVPAGTDRWSTLSDEPVNQTVELVTPWYDLAGMTPEEVLAVAVTGRPDDGTAVVVEFADGSGELVTGATVEVDLGGVENTEPGVWTREMLGARLHHPLGTSPQVRYRLMDRNFTPDGWLAMTAPYRVTGEPLTELFEGTSVALDWAIGFNMPCIEPPLVVDGMVEPVDWLVFSATFADAPAVTFVDDRGGSYGTVDEAADATAYRGFIPGVFPYTEWGRLIELDYELPTDAFRMERSSRTIAGWGWWPGAGPGPSPEE